MSSQITSSQREALRGVIPALARPKARALRKKRIKRNKPSTPAQRQRQTSPALNPRLRRQDVISSSSDRQSLYPQSILSRAGRDSRPGNALQQLHTRMRAGVINLLSGKLSRLRVSIGTVRDHLKTA
jgi:hypothetical protein